MVSGKPYISVKSATRKAEQRETAPVVFCLGAGKAKGEDDKDGGVDDH